jgi:hypothetical protein
VFLRFFRLGVLAFEVGERYVQRLVPETNSDGVDRYAFFMQRVGVGLAESVKLGAFNAGFLRNRLQLTQEVRVRFCLRRLEKPSQGLRNGRRGDASPDPAAEL